MSKSNVPELNVPILMYHHIHPGATASDGPSHLSLTVFESQLDLIARYRFTTITLKGLFHSLGTGRPMPKRVVVLTFDDAYETFHQFAYPALAARKMTGTLFVVASEIGGFNRWDMARGRRQLPLMSEEQLREVVADGVEVGSHGWAHRHLPRCSDAELHEEIVTSKSTIEKRVGADVKSFCYPYGEYAPAIFPLLCRSGYLGAVAFRTDQSKVTSEPYALRRVSVVPRDIGLRFRLKLTNSFLRYCARREIKAAKSQHEP